MSDKKESEFERLARIVNYHYQSVWRRDTDIAEWFGRTSSSVKRWRNGENDQWKNQIQKIIDEFPDAYKEYESGVHNPLRTGSELAKENEALRREIELLTAERNNLKEENEQLTKTVITGMELVRQARKEIEDLKKI